MNKKLGKCAEKIRDLKKKTMDRELSIVELVKQNYSKDAKIDQL